MHIFPGFFPWLLGGPRDWFPWELRQTIDFRDQYVREMQQRGR